jgi:hypothetical protein
MGERIWVGEATGDVDAIGIGEASTDGEAIGDEEARGKGPKLAWPTEIRVTGPDLSSTMLVSG